jgi:hypothetical protein
VLVVAGIQKRPPAAAGSLELIWELVQHHPDLASVVIEARGIESNRTDDSFGYDAIVGIVIVPRKTVEENGLNSLGGKDADTLCIHDNSS